MSKPASHPAGGLVRFKLRLSYDGTDFNGWAKQPTLRTVAGELLAALQVIFGPSETDFGLRVAGRTDAGVHALNQIAHLELTSAQLARLGRTKDWRLRLNSLLPADVYVSEISVAPAEFDARFSATHLRYRYRIADARADRNPLQSRFTLWVPKELDLELMQAAAERLYGLHDFASFCKPREGSTTIRELKEIQVQRNQADGGVIEIYLKADAFCHNMVRSIVGALIAVGEGKADADLIEQKLKQASRVGSYKVVAPNGLTLIEIGYPADSELAAQAEKARNFRTLDEN